MEIEYFEEDMEIDFNKSFIFEYLNIDNINLLNFFLEQKFIFLSYDEEDKLYSITINSDKENEIYYYLLTQYRRKKIEKIKNNINAN